MAIHTKWHAQAILPALTALVFLAMAGCSKSEEATAEEAEVLAVAPADVVVATESEIRTGPVISGSLQPERSSAVRAEVSGSVLQTYAEPGDAVRRDQVLARIDDAAIRDQAISARSGVNAAEQTAALARRNLERAQRLADAGAIAERDLEAARSQAAGAESQLADARARLALAQKQLGNTAVASPLSGIVSAKQVNGGDVVQPGAPLFTVVDPSRMQLEGSVPSDQLGMLRVGAPVSFQVRGYPGRTFTGTVTRINPVADPISRQVPVFVSIPNEGGTLVGGLFAEGRVAAEAKQALAVPMTAVDMSGNSASVMRLRGGTVERVPVQLGIRDDQSDRIEITNGIAAGDTLLVGAARGITPGSAVRVERLGDAPAGGR